MGYKPQRVKTHLAFKYDWSSVLSYWFLWKFKHWCQSNTSKTLELKEIHWFHQSISKAFKQSLLIYFHRHILMIFNQIHFLCKTLKGSFNSCIFHGNSSWKDLKWYLMHLLQHDPRPFPESLYLANQRCYTFSFRLRQDWVWFKSFTPRCLGFHAFQ